MMEEFHPIPLRQQNAEIAIKMRSQVFVLHQNMKDNDMINKPANAPKCGGSVTIQDWMVRLYQLQGDTLLIYAVIHSFSKDGESVFRGSLRYLAFWTGRSKPTVIKSLNYLLGRNLIYKREVHYTRLNLHRHYCEYWTIFSRLDISKQKELLRSIM